MSQNCSTPRKTNSTKANVWNLQRMAGKERCGGDEMTKWDDFGKDVEITISFNELMNILKAYDEVKVKNGAPCQMDDELYYPALTCACFSLLWKSKIKKAEIENQRKLEI